MSHVHGREGHHYFSDVPPSLLGGAGGEGLSVIKRLPEHLVDPSLDRLATLAANLTGCPVARISVIDDQWVVCRASVGAPRLIAPAGQSFCARARAFGTPIQVNNPADDPRFAHLSSLPHNQGVKFYAAQPLIDSAGAIIGILSLRDVLPHTLDQSELSTLEDIAALAVERLETIAHNYQMRTASATKRALEMAGSSLGLSYWRYEGASHTLQWSDGSYDLLGLDPRHTPSYRVFLRHVTAEDRMRVCQLIHRALRRSLPFSLKTTLIRPHSPPVPITLQGECSQTGAPGSRSGDFCAYGIAFCSDHSLT